MKQPAQCRFSNGSRVSTSIRRERYRAGPGGVVSPSRYKSVSAARLPGSFLAYLSCRRSRSCCSRASFANVVFFCPPAAMLSILPVWISRRGLSRHGQTPRRQHACDSMNDSRCRYRQHPKPDGPRAKPAGRSARSGSCALTWRPCGLRARRPGIDRASWRCRSLTASATWRVPMPAGLGVLDLGLAGALLL
jgi:hypothetical protein